MALPTVLYHAEEHSLGRPAPTQSLTLWVSRNFPCIRSGIGKAHVTAFFIRGHFARSTFLLLGDTRALLSLGISFAAVSVSRRDMWGLKRSFSALRARETSVDELSGNQVEEREMLIGCQVLHNKLWKMKMSFIRLCIL